MRALVLVLTVFIIFFWALSMYFFKTLIVMFLFVSQAVMADTIKLKNGDLITGSVVKKGADTLLFKTKYAGEIEITRSEIAKLKTSSPESVVLTDDAANIQPQTFGRVKGEGGGLKMAKALNMDAINAGMKVAEGFEWKGHINLGGAVTQGNTDTSLLRLDGEAIARSERDRITLSAYANRAQTNDVDTELNSKGKLQYDYFLTEKRFLYANTSLEKDQFRDIGLRSTFGFGSGYQIFEESDRNLSVEAGINYIDTDFDDAEDDRYISARWSLKYDQLIFQSVKFFHQHEVLMSEEGANNVLVFTQTGLRVPIAERLNATTQLNVDYAGQPAAGREKTDKMLLFSLGYGW
jgi:putative salt-induced outer membrane protein YdiY